MSKEEFVMQKRLVARLLNEENVNNENLTESMRESINTLLDVLKSYQYDNRLKIKGLISRIVIDSVELNSTICEQLVSFDQQIY